MIEEYATGGDGGVTQDVVRLATDLPLKRSTTNEDSIPAEFNIKESHEADLIKTSLLICLVMMNGPTMQQKLSADFLDITRHMQELQQIQLLGE